MKFFRINGFRERLRQRVLLLAFCVASVCGSVSAPAAEKVLVVSLKPSDELFTDITYLAKATGTAPFVQPMLPQLKAYFKGIDGTKPIGVVVAVEGDVFVPLGMVPVTDLNAVLAQFQGQLGEPVDAGNGILELQGPQPIFIKESNGWAFLGQSVESLAEVPANPAALLEGLDGTYDIAVRAYLKNVPDVYKQQALGQLEGMMAQAPGSSAEDKEAATKQLKQFVEEAESLTFGWRIDPKGREVNFDALLDPNAGTKLAQQFDVLRGMKTRFGGFLLEDAAISGNLASVFLPEEIANSVRQIDNFERSTLEQVDQDESLEDATRAAAKQLVSTFFEIVRSTIKTGKLDSCTSVVLKPGMVSLVSASHVASGSEVESAVKQLVELSKSDPEVTLKNVKLNVETHGGVRLHTMELPLPPDDKVKKAIGESLLITVGAADDSAYVALGEGGLAQLKQRIDASAAVSPSVEPMAAQVSLLPVMEFVKSIESNPIIESLTQMLANQKGTDQLHVRTSMTDKGVKYQLTLEEGVLSLIGQGVQFIGMQGGF